LAAGLAKKPMGNISNRVAKNPALGLLENEHKKYTKRNKKKGMY